ncbi:sterile alpha motif domain-containing protein 9-like [Myripristis murdjan]|uniref:Sterile alpha motif domain-containing protein 9-like n=1 Tax=Myripristis murdjan TaxID=586833 RepID=A0A667Y0M9_9TELE|nr:sterile alpha motif domain-containing protein 9-like [Myripristis murdjan]XP_029906141.1 sterile alpha motif domain-containing protein 9-like [Myripristis murdjan]
MSHSASKPPTPIEEWTKEEVHEWLMTQVKVHPSYANKFLEEEVSGDYLIAFDKKDILDLGIKHGPAVKILSYLERLKQGKYESQYPEYVEKWTTEQVKQWLLQHVKIYSKYAEQLQEEEVSGDCLVCFSKQDLVDLQVKSGPAVKILRELRELNNKPEPTLQPTSQPSTGQEEAPQPSPPQAPPTKQPEANKEELIKNEPRNEKMIKNESTKAQLPVEGAAIKEEAAQSLKPLRPQAQGAKRNKSDGMATQLIQETLDDLRKQDLKSFQFQLRHYTESQHGPIALSKLEDKDTIDTASTMTQHYGNENALQATLNILPTINQRQLARQLESKMGQLKLQCHKEEAPRREANHGDKLKNLLTCGGNSLDHYDRFVVVVNKSCPEQIEYLQFLNKMKLFCVLDFDPNSAVEGGLCHSYRESRVANLHAPSQYQGQTDTVMKDLNLYKQTSWVFCNGRHDLDSESNRELDYKNWLRKICRDIEQLVSFICKPEVLPYGRTLIIFLLLSSVQTEKDPLFETFRTFYKHTEEEHIISICESQSTYEKWKDLIQSKCECDITRQSVYELTLSEVNGTIMSLGPFNQSSGRLLPSSDSSSVVLKQMDEDLMTALDILCLNQCENIYEENSAEFDNFRIKVEEEFFRGGKVKWWNFYFCEKNKAKPFIKREKHEKLKKMIRSQSRDPTNPCVLFNLFHPPGCGGTTLAMHVMWDLRQDFRCAMLKDNTLPKPEVAIQVRKLMKLESDKPYSVLLLVDDSKETENAHQLVNYIREDVLDNCSLDDASNCQVIILNCVRTLSPKEQYRKLNSTPCQYITTSLTQKEKDDFEEKLKELRETHKKPENFYSFMIMKNNFILPDYINDIVRNTVENFDLSTKEAQLFAFLALLNNCVAESEISLSLAEDFLGMKMIRWREDSVLERMRPYSNFLIIDIVEELGGYKGIRILHRTIASACLEEFEKSYHMKVSDIAMDMLHCDLFFRVGAGRDRFMLSIQRMLIERQRKKDGDERQSFSSLIEKIHSQQGRQTVQDIFVKASSQFVKSASIPQALARYLYINERDFPEALKWAEKAKEIKENPKTVDTIGRVYKSNLQYNIQSEKQKTLQNPEDLDNNIKLAVNAIKAFQRAQDLANTEDELEKEATDQDSEDYPIKSSYNVYGYVGELEVAFLVFEILSRLPFFGEGDPMKKRYLQSFLKGTCSITSVYKEDTEINNRYTDIIKDHERFLLSLKTNIKDSFEFFDYYFTHLKATTLGEFDSKNFLTVSDHFKKYVTLFCSSLEEKRTEQANNPKLNLKMDLEAHRLFLEKNHADTFAGIFQHLDKHPDEMENISASYEFLQQNQQFINQKQKTKEKINYILSNIILNLLNPRSKYVKSDIKLSALCKETLQDVGLGYPFPDPYYLALLLFWPSSTQEDTEIRTYVTAIRKSSHRRLSILFRKRSTIAYFYLGKEKGLRRLVPKPKLDECFLEIKRSALAQLWRNGDIFKEQEIIKRLHRVSGTIELGEVFAIYGKLKIPVHPAFGGIRSGLSTEKVSFYLGFAINGPIAYDIQYEN